MSDCGASDLEVRGVPCAVCGKALTGAEGFVRFRPGERIVTLCCSSCAEAFESSPYAYLRRMETEERSRPPGGPFQHKRAA